MKIIRPGLPKKELERRLKNTKQFECKNCGCIFEADKDEYEIEEEYIYTTYYCKCPNCNNNAFERRSWNE